MYQDLLPIYLDDVAMYQSNPLPDAVSHVKCADPLPLDQYFSIIQSHFQCRVKISELTSQLNDVAHQYRMVEKRLLVRYKDRNPTALGGLDYLMKDTYNKLIAISK
jgi:Bardet-Biedl syndrome 9 protein